MSEYDDYKSRSKNYKPSAGSKFKFPVGTTRFRILKTPKGTNSPSVWIQYQMHENVGPEKQFLRCGINPETGKGKCLVENKIIPRLKKRGFESRAAALEPKVQVSIQISVVDDNDNWSDPILVTPPKKMADQIIGQIIPNKRKDYLDHKKGYCLSVTRTGTTKNDTRYGMLEADDESTRVPKSVLEKLKPFEDLKELRKYDEERMKTALGLMTDEDDDDDEEEDDDEDSSSKKNKKKKKSKKDEDDDDDDDGEEDSDDEDDDEDDEDSDDDDEDDEDDDEDEEDDDDDEDDEPVKKKKKSSKKKKK
jgi:hypothetical protein